MPKITYIEANGTPHEIDVAAGHTVMEAAVRNGVPGIEGDCGGACACATCHVYVADAWRDRIGTASADEGEMLECANDVLEASRLSCQIVIEDALDGLVVHLPVSQR